MRFLLALCGVLALTALFAQDVLQIQVPKGPVPWTSLQLNRPAEQFQFAIVTDRTGGVRPGVFNTAIDKLNLLQPEFVMSVGDLITGYTEDTIELNRQWNEFEGMVGRLQMPFFYLPGNHDLTNATQAELWKQRFGATYYHFVYKDVLFLCLNSEDQLRGAGRGAISNDQYDYIERVLRENADVRWTLVFLHQPLWEQTDSQRWPAVERLLRDRPHHVFAGHVHHYVKYTRNNGHYYTLATTGGGSRLRGPRLGEFDHVSWVTMTDAGPIIANLALDGIQSDSLVTKADYDFITSIYKSKPIRFEPLIFPEKSFKVGNAHMKFHNPTDRPMRIEIKPKFSFDYLPEMPSDTLLVPPNSVEDFNWRLRARRATKFDKLGPQGLDIDVIYDYEGSELRLPFHYLLSPTSKHRIPQNGRVRVDGKLKDWPELPYRLDTPKEATCSVDWGFTYDNERLYLAARVKDDRVVVRPGEKIRQQDFIGFVINGDPMTTALIDAGEDNYRHSAFLTFSPEKERTPSASAIGNDLAIEVPYVCRATEDGYVLEASVPLSYLNDRQGNPWRHLRINWVVQDEDLDSQSKPRYWWQPEWNGSETVVGSGLFFRENPE
jgi:hypothetical protein